VKQTMGILALLVMMAAYSAPAADLAPLILRLNLKDAISMAIDKNNLVKSVGYRAEAARQGIDIAGSRYYPSVSFEEAFTASNAPTQVFMMKLDQGRFSQNDFQINNLNHPAVSHDFRTVLTLNQPLYAPSVGPAREIAAKEAEKKEVGVEAAKQYVAFQVFRLYLDVQKAVAQIQASGLAVKEARENMRLAAVRKEAGIGLRSDELRARTHLASVEQQLISAENNLRLAKMQLANVIGLRENQAVDIVEPSITLTLTASPQELSSAALDSRSDLKQYRAELERSEAEVKLAGSAYLPTLDAVASYHMNAKDTPFGSDNDAWLAGVSLKWQIFDGFRHSSDRKRAIAERSAAAEMLENTTRDISFQVLESWLRREEAGKRLEVARHALQDAEETVRLLMKRLENSLATMFEVLDAQSALNQTRSNLVENEADYSLAGGRVYYTSGIFLKELLK
jgi:outer membrane protein TolC